MEQNIMRRLSVALLHHPVYNSRGNVVTTAVTNLDIHDIARIARTYDLRRFYIITPLTGQRELVRRILNHWQQGAGATCNPLRKEAFTRVTVCASLDDAHRDVSRESGSQPLLAATSAIGRSSALSCSTLAARLKKTDRHCLVLFGTGWGLSRDVIDRADAVLEPIEGSGDYNHLSVRAAVAIIMDRLARASGD